ncbi:MAG: hypothetical protein KAS39_02160 [Actinomycetia bacterium]|nr:hypothetical protein [Actinomycetes bacterium]
MEKEFFKIGKIKRPFGLNGELVIECLTDFPNRYKPALKVYISSPMDEKGKLTIENIKKSR